MNQEIAEVCKTQTTKPGLKVVPGWSMTKRRRLTALNPMVLLILPGICMITLAADEDLRLPSLRRLRRQKGGPF